VVFIPFLDGGHIVDLVKEISWRYRMRKAITGLAIVALVAGVALVAVSLSQTPSALAQETEDRVFNRPFGEVLDGLVEDGTITEDQRQRIATAFEERFIRFGTGHHRTPHLETIAAVLNMDVDDLAAELKDGASIADIAGEAKVEAVVDALVAEHENRITEAVADGRLTQEEAEEARTALADRVNAMVNGEHPTGFKSFGMDRFHRCDGYGFKNNFGLDQIAEELDLSVDELRERLAGGSTLAEIADDQSVSAETLVDTLLADLDEKLDALVADERLTQERADEVREGSAAMIESMINGEMPGFGGLQFHHGERFHGRGMPGPGGFFGPEHEVDRAGAAA
jgi:DNA-directed RNA polymerase specialized sigma subunit